MTYAQSNMVGGVHLENYQNSAVDETEIGAPDDTRTMPGRDGRTGSRWFSGCPKILGNDVLWARADFVTGVGGLWPGRFAANAPSRISEIGRASWTEIG